MSYPLCQAPEHWPHQILKGGCRLLCENLADSAPVSAARGCGPVVAGAAGLLAGHLANPAPAGAIHGRDPAATSVAGLSAEHLANPALVGVTHGCGPAAAGATGLSAEHGPLRAARDRGPVVAGAAGLSAGHGFLHGARGPTAVAGLWWTCGPDSSVGNQRQEEAMKSRLGNLHLRLSPTE